MRVLMIDSGDDWRAIKVPADWDADDVDRYLNGKAYGRAAVLTVEDMPDDVDRCGHGVPIHGEDCEQCDEANAESDSFLSSGEYGGGSM